MKSPSQQVMKKLSPHYFSVLPSISSHTYTLSLQRRMPAAEAQLSVVMKGEGGNYGKPHPVEMMKGQNLPQTAYFLPQQLPVCLTQTPIWSKEGHSPPPASARGLLVCSPGLGILHCSLVRISQLYSGLCQSWPVRNERELLRSETLRKAI